MKIRGIVDNSYASAVPIILFLITIIGVGALYTLFFIEIGIPTFSSWIPASDSKTFIMMCIYALPLFIIVVGVVCLIKAGLKRSVMY